MKVFLTGFDRFASLAFNPSELVVSEIRRLAQRSLTTELVVQVLPTEYDRAGEMVSEQVRRIRPVVDSLA
jgi:pyrrolidone-carboxylate peptidase